MSRLLKHNLMEDVFNNENESFMQETKLMENEYSVNLPTRFYYKKKWQRGWINVVNPFRATIVLGTPGSGKSFAVVNNYIKQQIEKGYSMYISSNPQPIGFSGILLAKRKNSFYCTYFLHNRNVADTKSPYPIKRLEVIRGLTRKAWPLTKVCLEQVGISIVV